MKSKIFIKIFIIVSISIALVFAVTTGILGCAPISSNDSSVQSYRQNLDYSEQAGYIVNPDQGFYRPIYVKVSQSGVSFNKNIITDKMQLYHLRIDISEFSKAVNKQNDILLTQSALDGIEELLTILKQNNKNAIVRFAYAPSFGDKADREPAMAMIESHIRQVCVILNKFQNTITAVEAGLIGPWGEMHTSAIAKPYNISAILNAYLDNTSNIPILARTPKMIYDFLQIDITDIDDYKIQKDDTAYRLGIYNDGYLGSDSDLGTYRNRDKEIDFLSRQCTDHLPYGGEVVAPDSTLHNIENCLPEMAKIHLSYLNVEWNNQVIDKWKNTYYTSACGDDSIYYNQTAFAYIQAHMGYRFVLKESVFEYSQKFDALNVKLTLDNVGFGNLNKTKLAKLVFVYESGQIAQVKQVSNFSGQLNLDYSVDLNLTEGVYDVYICIYGEEADGKMFYGLRFANKDIWNDLICGNKIGEITVKK